MLNHDLAFNLLKTQNDLIIAARLAHWNVRGPNFYEAHQMFGRIYDKVSDKTDTLVETLRFAGYDPTFEEFGGPGGELSTFSATALAGALTGYCTSYFASLVQLQEASKDDPMLVGLVNLLEQLCEDASGVMFLLTAAQGN